MEDDSPPNQSTESIRFPIRGMESVVATVSGYHGSERFNLIKLISRSGASYVGTMSPSVTHLVCWKFEGKKYELAKKLNAVIVNHRWVEECVRKGRRVSENPFTLQCGEEVGPVSLDISFNNKKRSDGSKAENDNRRAVIDLDSEEIDDAFSPDPMLLSENLLHDVNHPRFRQDQPKKRSLRKDHPCYRQNDLDESFLSNPEIEPEQLRSSQPGLLRRVNKRKPASPETSRRGRRLVKKQKNVKASEWDLEHNCELAHSSYHIKDDRPPNILDREKCKSTCIGHQLDEKCCRSGPKTNETLTNVEEIEDVNDVPGSEHQNLAVQDSLSSLLRTPGDDHAANNELSCVICWTDFSSTRGVLPCGHRFCFSCIQSWADHMVSRRKASTCPLCKSNFMSITKVEDAESSDQKIYSQTIPHDNPKMDINILPEGQGHFLPSNPSAAVCCQCSSREPVDLLVRCHLCEIRCVHSYCLDPPLLPWTCTHCKDLQVLYHLRMR